MNIQNTILGLLLKEPQTGYELKQLFDSSLAFFSGASFGSIYPALKRCEKEGLVNMEMELQDGKPNRKVYYITEAGKDIFLKGMQEELTISPYRNEFLTRLFFFADITAKERTHLIESYLNYLAMRQEQIHSLADFAKKKADPYQILCYRFGLRFVENLIANTRLLYKELKDMNK